MAITDTLQGFHLAERLSIPQLVEALKRGTIDQAIGQLVLNNKVKLQKKMQTAQAQGQPEQPPIAQQNMAMAEEAQVSPPLPQEWAGHEDPMAEHAGMAEQEEPTGYARGGIVGFQKGGSVEDEEYVPSWLSGVYDWVGGKTGHSGEAISKAISGTTKKTMGGIAAATSVPTKSAITSAASALPLTRAAGLLDPDSLRTIHGFLKPSDAEAASLPPESMPPPDKTGIAAIADQTGGRGAGAVTKEFSLPDIKAMGVDYAAPDLKSYDEVIASAKANNADLFRKRSKERETELGAGDKEAFEEIRKDIEGQKGSLSKSDEKNIWLSLLKGSLATLGGKSQHAFVNIGEGGKEGVSDYVKRDVLNRETEKHLAARDQALKLEQLAQRKGNMVQADQYAANAAQQDHMANQLQMSAIGGANEDIRGLAGLEMQGKIANAQIGMRGQELSQQAAIEMQKAQILRERYAGMGAKAKADFAKIEQAARSEFMTNPMLGPSLNKSLSTRYGAQWGVPYAKGGNVEAQQEWTNALKHHITNNLYSTVTGAAMGPNSGMQGTQGARSFEELYSE